MKKFEITTRGFKSSNFNMKCLAHNGLSGVGKSYSEVEVSGRDFPLIRDLKTRDRFILKVDVIIDSLDVRADARNIKKWLLNDIKDLSIELSDIPNYYFLGFYDSKLDIEEVINQVGRCTLNFNCQPFLRLKSGDSYLTLTDNYILNNTYGVEAKPLIKLTSTGEVKFTIGNQLVHLKDTNGVTYIDSEIMDAYLIDGSGKAVLQNYKMYSDFPILKPGENKYVKTLGTITKIEIMPRWRVM